MPVAPSATTTSANTRCLHRRCSRAEASAVSGTFFSSRSYKKAKRELRRQVFMQISGLFLSCCEMRRGLVTSLRSGAAGKHETCGNNEPFFLIPGFPPAPQGPVVQVMALVELGAAQSLMRIMTTTFMLNLTVHHSGQFGDHDLFKFSSDSMF